MGRRMASKSPSAVQNRVIPTGSMLFPPKAVARNRFRRGKATSILLGLDLDPTWSKDGSALMYGVLPAPGEPEPAKIMLLDLKTRAVTHGSDGICCPRWSPDGRWVIALSADKQKLFLLDMSTQKWRQVADKIGIIGYMTWSRDSKYVGFDTSSPSIQHFVACLPPMDK